MKQGNATFRPSDWFTYRARHQESDFLGGRPGEQNPRELAPALMNTAPVPIAPFLLRGCQEYAAKRGFVIEPSSGRRVVSDGPAVAPQDPDYPVRGYNLNAPMPAEFFGRYRGLGGPNGSYPHGFK